MTLHIALLLIVALWFCLERPNFRRNRDASRLLNEKEGL